MGGLQNLELQDIERRYLDKNIFKNCEILNK